MWLYSKVNRTRTPGTEYLSVGVWKDKGGVRWGDSLLWCRTGVSLRNSNGTILYTRHHRVVRTLVERSTVSSCPFTFSGGLSVTSGVLQAQGFKYGSSVSFRKVWVNLRKVRTKCLSRLSEWEGLKTTTIIMKKTNQGPYNLRPLFNLLSMTWRSLSVWPLVFSLQSTFCVLSLFSCLSLGFSYLSTSVKSYLYLSVHVKSSGLP